jgi:hypothetical protein
VPEALFYVSHRSTDRQAVLGETGAAGNWNGNVASNPATNVGGLDIECNYQCWNTRFLSAS